MINSKSFIKATLVIAATALVIGSVNIFTTPSFAAGSGGRSCFTDLPQDICSAGGGGSGKGGGGGGGSGTGGVCNTTDCALYHQGNGGGSGQGGGGGGGSTGSINCPNADDLSTCTTSHSGSGGSR